MDARGEFSNARSVAGGSQLVFEVSTPDGKPWVSFKEQTGSSGYDSAIFANSNEGTRWERWKFSWGQVRGWNTDTSSANNTSQLFFLAANPGEYEVKVLREGDLARSAKFTVGPDGRLVDNGITQKNNLGGLAMVLPVKVLGTGDGTWDTSAWKTDAFYGNPLSGFIAP